jgi:hypothetical protein
MLPQYPPVAEGAVDLHTRAAGGCGSALNLARQLPKGLIGIP